MSQEPLRVIIVGAGIGGLAAAVGLRRAGIDVKVFERARELGEVGSAFFVWTNGMRALQGSVLPSRSRLSATRWRRPST